MRGVSVALLCAVSLYALPAHADAVDARARSLQSSGEYKVRMSAALWLSRQDDPRAVTALARALRTDGESTIRSVAAVALGNMLDERVPAPVRDDAIAALEQAAARDPDRNVRRNAQRSYDKVKAMRPTGASTGVFVAIGEPNDQSRRLSAASLPLVQAAVRRALRQHAPGFAQGTRADGLPTQAELRRTGAQGFFVNASVSSIEVRRRAGGRVEVSCTVHMRVSLWAGRDGQERLRENEAASATGRGKVVGVDSGAGIADAGRDCALAVVEEITARQVVPFIERRVDRRVAKTR